MLLQNLSLQYNLHALIQKPHGQIVTNEKYQQEKIKSSTETL